MLSQLQVERVCMLNKGSDQCRYLDVVNDKCFCKKKSPDAKFIEAEVADFIKNAKKNNINPYTQKVPLGDGNGCKGYLYLSNKLQGFDV
jgi:hypothetical protein